MIFVAIFFPAFLALFIKYRKSQIPSMFKAVLEYGVYTILVTLITQIVLTYIFGVHGIVQDALQSFSFFIKYTIVASIIAILISVIQMTFRKYIDISVKVETYDEKETK